MLGQGGMATVWRAFDREQGGLRAVKVVHPSLVGRKVRRRLTQEAELMARLLHPNVVRLIGLGEDDDRLFLVMELVEGGSVADRTAEGRPLPPRMAVEVALGLLAALGYAHRHGVVHRDVKPHNVLLDLDGTPRVTDFGIARWEAVELTRTGAVLGTLAYMAPEQKASARAPVVAAVTEVAEAVAAPRADVPRAPRPRVEPATRTDAPPTARSAASAANPTGSDHRRRSSAGETRDGGSTSRDGATSSESVAAASDRRTIGSRGITSGRPGGSAGSRSRTPISAAAIRSASGNRSSGRKLVAVRIQGRSASGMPSSCSFATRGSRPAANRSCGSEPVSIA